MAPLHQCRRVASPRRPDHIRPLGRASHPLIHDTTACSGAGLRTLVDSGEAVGLEITVLAVLALMGIESATATDSVASGGAAARPVGSPH
jgi:hypothetical protein